MICRITPKNINSLGPNQIFVFGSNESGYHGKGAAKTAFLKYGAKYYQHFGLQGDSFAIPTKNKQLKTLPLNKISDYINDFIDFAKLNPNKIFLVTEIGCGLAGYRPEDIAPMFKDAIHINNIHLPKSFWDILNSQ